MTKLFIENANREASASIRIYPLDENSQVIAPDSFTSMDDLGLSFGIALAPKTGIVCTPQDLRVSESKILGRTFTAGEWSIDYQLNGGETRTYTTTLGGGDWQWDVFRAMMQSILNQEDSGIQWVDGGGGIGHFQLYSWSLTAGSGDAGGPIVGPIVGPIEGPIVEPIVEPIVGPIGGEVDNSRSVKLIRNDNHNADLFWFFFDIFDDLPNGSSVEAISCGFSAFPGF